MMRQLVLIILANICLSFTSSGQQRLWYGSIQPLQDSSNLTLHLGSVIQELSTNTPLSAWSGNTLPSSPTIHAFFENQNDLLCAQYRVDDLILSYSMGLYQRNSFYMSNNLFSILYCDVQDSVKANYGQQRTSSVRQSFYGELKLNSKLTAGLALNLHASNSHSELNYNEGYIDTRNHAIDINALGTYYSSNTSNVDSSFSNVQLDIPITQLEPPYILSIAQRHWSPSISLFVELKPTSFVRLRVNAENIAPKFYRDINSLKVGYSMNQSAGQFSPEDFIEGEALVSNYNFSTTRRSVNDTVLLQYKHPAFLGSSIEVDFSDHLSFIAVNHFTWYPEFVRMRLQILAKAALSNDQFLITGVQTTNTYGRLHPNLVFAGATRIHPQIILKFSTETLLNAAYVQRKFGPAPLSRYQFQCSLQISIP